MQLSVINDPVIDRDKNYGAGDIRSIFAGMVGGPADADGRLV